MRRYLISCHCVPHRVPFSTVYFMFLIFLKLPLFLSVLGAVLCMSRCQRGPRGTQSRPDQGNAPRSLQGCPVQEHRPSDWTGETCRLWTLEQGSSSAWTLEGLEPSVPKGRSWILEDTRAESSGGGKMSLQAPVWGPSFSSPDPLVPCPHAYLPRKRTLWKLDSQEPGSLLFSLAQKLLNPVSPGAITTSFLQTEGSPRTRPSLLRSPSSQGSISSSGTVPRGFGPGTMPMRCSLSCMLRAPSPPLRPLGLTGLQRLRVWSGPVHLCLGRPRLSNFKLKFWGPPAP